MLAVALVLLLAKKAVPADDLKGFISWLEANLGKAVMGHAGTGGMGHVAGVLFQKETGTRFGFVPYRGSAAADLVAGQIDLQFGDTTSVAQVRAGLVAFATDDPVRLPLLPTPPRGDAVTVGCRPM